MKPPMPGLTSDVIPIPERENILQEIREIRLAVRGLLRTVRSLEAVLGRADTDQEAELPPIEPARVAEE